MAIVSEYVTAHEAAQLCGVNESTMFRWIAHGRIHGEKAAVNRWAIRRASLPGHRPSLAERMSELERHMSALESQMSALITQRGSAITRTHLLAPSDLTPIRTHNGAQWPVSVRGRAKVIAGVTGLSWRSIQNWPEVATWESYADAVQWVKEHKGITL